MAKIVYIQQPIPIIICLFLALSVTACCGDIQISASVHPDSLYLAKSPQGAGELSDILSQRFFEQFPTDENKTRLTKQWFFSELHSFSSYDIVDVEVELFASENESAKRYQETCNDTSVYQYPKNFTFVESAGNQYCISYIREGRQDPEGLCKPNQTYFTQAVFQKGQILITLKESSWDTLNSEMNRVIALFAEELNKQSKP